MPIETLPASSFLDHFVPSIFPEGRRLAFVLGSGLTIPTSNYPGVGGSRDIQERVVAKLRGSSGLGGSEVMKKLEPLENEGLGAATYYRFFQALREHKTANRSYYSCIREAVLAAFDGADLAPETGLRLADVLQEASKGNPDACLDLERVVGRWYLRPGVEALGRLVVGSPEKFGSAILTTNFDPLIEVATRKAGGCPVSIAVQDSTLEVDALLRIVHVHGKWSSANMVSSLADIETRRERVSTYVSRLVRSCDFLVCGYGGWDRALVDVLCNSAATNDHIIYWCLTGRVDENDSPALKTLRSRATTEPLDVVFVEGVNSDVLIPEVLKAAQAGGLVEQFQQPYVPSQKRAWPSRKTILGGLRRVRQIRTSVKGLQTVSLAIETRIGKVETDLTSLKADLAEASKKLNTLEKATIDLPEASKKLVAILEAVERLLSIYTKEKNSRWTWRRPWKFSQGQNGSNPASSSVGQ